MLGSSQNILQEELIIQGVPQDEHKFDNNPEVQSVLSDFDNLDFSNGPFNYPAYDMNYNRLLSKLS